MLALAGDVDSAGIQRFYFYSNPAAKKKKLGFFRARDFSRHSPSPLLRGFPARAERKEMEAWGRERERRNVFLFPRIKTVYVTKWGAARSAGTHHFEFRMGAFEERGKRKEK